MLAEQQELLLASRASCLRSPTQTPHGGAAPRGWQAASVHQARQLAIHVAGPNVASFTPAAPGEGVGVWECGHQPAARCFSITATACRLQVYPWVVSPPARWRVVLLENFSKDK